HTKEEPEEHGIRKEGEKLQDVEEADITKFPFTLVTVKSEEDEEKVLSSQLHQSQTEENREAENLSSSSTKQNEIGSHVEDCGRPGPSRNSDPGSYVQPACDGSHTERRKKAFGCSVCGKNYTQSGDLKIHMRIHTGENVFICSECGKNFTQNRNLKTHMRIHTGEKPFSCSLCCKKFTRSEGLKKHMRIHTRKSHLVVQNVAKHSNTELV
ncbi:hypothetical protein LDENG_00067170, partial [Lucifuga dentata]